jgi:hypothetical protein
VSAFLPWKKGDALIMRKMGWATFWAIFSQTHLFALFLCPFPLIFMPISRFWVKLKTMIQVRLHAQIFITLCGRL